VGLHDVGVARTVDLFQDDGIARDAELAFDHLVDRKELMQPAARFGEELVPLAQVRCVRGGLNSHRAHALAFQRRDHLLGHPEESRLVGREDAYPRPCLSCEGLTHRG
jgi:hypothetical protein